MTQVILGPGVSGCFGTRLARSGRGLGRQVVNSQVQYNFMSLPDDSGDLGCAYSCCPTLGAVSGRLKPSVCLTTAQAKSSSSIARPYHPGHKRNKRENDKGERRPVSTH